MRMQILFWRQMHGWSYQGTFQQRPSDESMLDHENGPGELKVPLKTRVLKRYLFYISATLDARQTMRK